ncbi:MAG: dihydroorotase [Candidatus Omnitrophota bacterium]
MNILIKGAQVVDPANKIDQPMDVLIEDGKIAAVQKTIRAKAEKVIDAQGKIVTPGLIDMHAHLRQPGREDEETLFTGASAAARGGFTTVVCMANTAPPIDDQGLVKYILLESEKIGLVRVLPVAAVTKGLKGEELTEVGTLKEAGCVALSDDGRPVASSEIMRRALEYAAMFDLPIISHCEDLALSAGGLMHEAYLSTIMGLPGIPDIAESVMVARDLQLAGFTAAKLHFAHISSGKSVTLIRQAKSEKLTNISSETCPHYFSLTCDAVRGFDPNAKVNPPLRTEEDVQAIRQGLADGTIDVIATDHAPHTEAEKDVEFSNAPFGMIGLETALSLGLSELVVKKVLTFSQLVEKMSVNPAKILGIEGGSLSVGAAADVLIFDPHKQWQVTKEGIVSKSKNSPFIGRTLPGVVEYTICKGKIVYSINRDI